MNAVEISEMYANEIAKHHNDKVIETACATPYNPAALEEDFKDKVGVLGTAVFWTMYHQWPKSDYDDTIGVKIEYVKNREDKEVIFPPDELRAFKKDQACLMFYELEKRIREKYKVEVSELTKTGK